MYIKNLATLILVIVFLFAIPSCDVEGLSEEEIVFEPLAFVSVDTVVVQTIIPDSVVVSQLSPFKKAANDHGGSYNMLTFSIFCTVKDTVYQINIERWAENIVLVGSDDLKFSERTKNFYEDLKNAQIKNFLLSLNSKGEIIRLELKEEVPKRGVGVIPQIIWDINH